MAIAMRVKESDISYTDFISALDESVIFNAKKQFDIFQERGIIKNKSFEDDIWIMTNEVKTCSINFGFDSDELRFEHLCRNALGISLKRFQMVEKVFITSCFGSELKSLQAIICGCKKILSYVSGAISLENLKQYAAFLYDFVDLIPSSAPRWEELVSEIECLETSYNSTGQRKLGSYQSYFRFEKIMSDFWLCATEDNKTLFFPIFLWWKLTGILPLRPTEFILIPRDCLNEIDGYDWLTIRRTKLKGEKFAAEYSIAKDYEEEQYCISKGLAYEIKRYIDKTKKSINSDIKTLLCQNFQYQKLGLVKLNNSPHYTYTNLRSCLAHFYKAVIKNQYQVIEKLVDFGARTLNEKEIERINLGDTRHIAMIGLIASGGNPVICKELANHSDINISTNYYANLKTFVEALSFERNRTSTFSIAPPRTSLLPDAPKLEDGGRCASTGVANGDYSDCMSAFSPDGHLMVCRYCKYYTAPMGGRIKVDIESVLQHGTDKTDRVMKDSFDNLLYYINLARSGLGYESNVQSALLRLQASVSQYTMIIDRAYKALEA